MSRDCGLPHPAIDAWMPGPVNYLAHLYLAEPAAASRVGNLLGDFVRGRIDSLAADLPAPLVAGILRHRTLDRFTDSHPAVTDARSLVAPERSRFAGVVVDIAYDHVLARQWDDWADEALGEFLAKVYNALEDHRAWLPPELAGSLDERRAADWLGHYGSEEGMHEVFRRIAGRHPRFGPARDGWRDVLGRYDEFERSFHRFFPDIIQHVRDLGPELDAMGT